MEVAERPLELLDSQATHQEDSLGPQHEETLCSLDPWSIPGTTSKSDLSTQELLLPHPKAPPRHFWERLGTSGLLILIVGTLVLFACPGVLIFLWIGADQASKSMYPSQFWQTIVYSGWLTRTITILTAAMRAAVTLQAAMVASMTSAIFLESASTNLYQLPLLSITRAVRLSPLSLLKYEQLKGKTSSKATYTHSFIILISSVLVVMSQFISTILFSDFASISILGPKNSASIYFADPVSLGINTLFLDRNNACGTAPSAFWRFAEYHEDAEHEEETA
ncbi:hypothetical protein PG997_013985 [Apiospora hydei]|uniref:Uncharacterized protein n=1 Tax=Apiospora hydei TaxID=1337664 RepID=A0ABR1V7U9_9PEZI